MKWDKQTEEKTYWESSEFTEGAGQVPGDHHLVWEARIEHDGNDSWTWWVCVGDHTVEGSVTGVEDSVGSFTVCQGMVVVVVRHILKGHG